MQSHRQSDVCDSIHMLCFQCHYKGEFCLDVNCFPLNVALGV